MSFIEKLGLMIALLGFVYLSSDIETEQIVAIFCVILGWILFSIPWRSAPNTGMHADDAPPPQEEGDLTPPDVHVRMWRLRNPRRR